MRTKRRSEAIRAFGTSIGGPLSEETQVFLQNFMPGRTIGSQALHGFGAEAYRRQSAGDPKAVVHQTALAMAALWPTTPCFHRRIQGVAVECGILGELARRILRRWNKSQGADL